MDDRKAQAIELGETAGEAYATKLYQRSGLAAMAATLAPGAETWEQEALDAFFSPSDEVHAEEAAKPERVHPYCLPAYCTVFARGARRCAEMFVRGDAYAKAPPRSAADKLQDVKGLFGTPHHDAVVAELGASATTDQIVDALLYRVHRLGLGDRPAVMAAFDAAFAAAKGK